MKFYIGRDAGNCCYEEWNKERHGMGQCLRPAVCQTKDGATFVGLCPEHALFHLNERSECFLDVVTKIDSKESHSWQIIDSRTMLKLIKQKAEAGNNP